MWDDVVHHRGEGEGAFLIAHHTERMPL
jgi:hypothetical protein